MNIESNIFDLIKYKERMSLINKESYLDYSEKMVVDVDEDLVFSRVKYFVDFFNAGYSVSYEQLDQQNHWHLDRFIIAILESEQFILRIPATKRYIKTVFAEEPMGNCLITANTTSHEGYLALPTIESEMVYFEVTHPEDEKLFSCSDREFTFDNHPKIESHELSDEASVLKFLNIYGVVSYSNIINSLGKDRGALIIEQLESNNKIMRISGTMFYIRYISSEMKSLKVKFEMISGGLNETGINAVLKTEAKCFTSLLLILTKSDPRASMYLTASLAATEERIKRH